MAELLEHHHHRKHEDSRSKLRRPPMVWSQFVRSVRHRWLMPLLFVDWMAQWGHYGLRRLSILELLETCSSFTLLVGLIFYFAEAPERTKARHYQAWQVINTAQGKGGNGGRIDALRELNGDQVPLVGVDVSDAFLQGVDLHRADLRRSTFRGADLKTALLVDANLEQANLRQANLREARLSGSDLDSSDFTDADLANAELNGASVKDAEFSRADLRGTNLTGLREWRSARFHLSNIHGLRSAPDGFVSWALSQGAVDIADDAAWNAALK